LKLKGSAVSEIALTITYHQIQMFTWKY
jgi:hypothetical protein